MLAILATVGEKEVAVEGGLADGVVVTMIDIKFATLCSFERPLMILSELSLHDSES